MEKVTDNANGINVYKTTYIEDLKAEYYIGILHACGEYIPVIIHRNDLSYALRSFDVFGAYELITEPVETVIDKAREEVTKSHHRIMREAEAFGIEMHIEYKDTPQYAFSHMDEPDSYQLAIAEWECWLENVLDELADVVD